MGKFVPFNIDDQVLIEHVNTRRSKGDDSPVCVDLKITVDALPIEAAAAALAARGTGEVEQAFFSAGKPRFLGMDVLPIDREFLAKHLATFADLDFEPIRVSKLFNIRLLPLIEATSRRRSPCRSRIRRPASSKRSPRSSGSRCT